MYKYIQDVAGTQDYARHSIVSSLLSGFPPS